MKLGEADIYAVEIGDEVTQDKEWYQPPHHLSDCPLFYIFHGEASRFGPFGPLPASADFKIAARKNANGIFRRQTRAVDTAATREQ
jgi:hypothetical protein